MTQHSTAVRMTFCNDGFEGRFELVRMTGSNDQFEDLFAYANKWPMHVTCTIAQILNISFFEISESILAFLVYCLQ